MKLGGFVRSEFSSCDRPNYSVSVVALRTSISKKDRNDMNINPSLPATQEKNLSAEIIPFENPAKQEYVDAIRIWCVDRSLENALKPEEIGALRREDRIDAQRKSIILALSNYYRKHERADVAPGIAVIVALLSDNEKGLATLSQPTLATFFGRSRSAIGDAQKRLKDDGIIGMTRGRYAGSYPIIPREVTHQYNHMTWLIEAINAQNGALNLPAPPADCQSTGPTGGLIQSTDRSGGLKLINQPVETSSINRPDATQLHSNNSTTLDRAAKAAAMGIAGMIGALPAAAAPIEPPAIIQPAQPSLSTMMDRMIAAAGHSLANPAASPGLLVPSELKRWLANGCDFEEDILPAITAAAVRRDNGSVFSWSFFTQQVANAKATRLAPMPTGNVQAPQKSGWRKPMSRSEMIEAGIKPDDMPEVVWNKLQADIARSKSC